MPSHAVHRASFAYENAYAATMIVCTQSVHAYIEMSIDTNSDSPGGQLMGPKIEFNPAAGVGGGGDVGTN